MGANNELCTRQARSISRQPCGGNPVQLQAPGLGEPPLCTRQAPSACVQTSASVFSNTLAAATRAAVGARPRWAHCTLPMPVVWAPQPPPPPPRPPPPQEQPPARRARATRAPELLDLLLVHFLALDAGESLALLVRRRERLRLLDLVVDLAHEVLLALLERLRRVAQLVDGALRVVGGVAGARHCAAQGSKRWPARARGGRRGRAPARRAAPARGRAASAGSPGGADSVFFLPKRFMRRLASGRWMRAA